MKVFNTNGWLPIFWGKNEGIWWIGFNVPFVWGKIYIFDIKS